MSLESAPSERASSERGPIFIGGLSGSGKTQLRLVLGAHPDISMTRRSYLWNRFYGRFGSLDDPENLERCLAVMAADRDVQRLDPDWDRIRRELLAGQPNDARLIGLVHDHYAQGLGKQRWGEQLRFVECFADPIFANFPTARMIHMVSDPRTAVTGASSSSGPRPGKLGWELAVWLHSAELAQRNLRRYPDRYRVVHRETFAAQQKETVEDLCAFVGEEYVPPVADAVRSLRFSETAPSRTAPLVDLYTRRALTSLGYERASRSPRRRHLVALTAWPLNRATMTAWRMTRGGPLTRRARA